MRRLKLVIEYDGTSYHGWQRQPTHRTIQQTLEEALEKIIQTKTPIVGASRTDRGVHAMEQLAHCQIESLISDQKLLKGLNTILPADIKIRKLKTVDISFHAQKEARSKIYIYQIFNHPSPSPLLRHYSWWLRDPLTLSKMKKAAKLLVGTQDFKAFQNTGTKLNSTTRTLFKSTVQKKSPYIIYEVKGTGFLKQMVRNIVGALVAVGKENLTLEEFQALLTSKNRKLCPPPAPPQGLFLKKVFH